eukprot:TRINITY_DN34795_c0_g1_i1.p1 TRINITY_DN34795_c0_g1~~TRINITY_DN34795_c0_g1_i1.p1  ORF type:complete len:419 (-),score=62.96 TRINITY_DN34795_c0_g1_i1:351-1550(-)
MAQIWGAFNQGQNPSGQLTERHFLDVVGNVQRVDKTVDYLHGHARGQSLAYLACGSICGFLGFLFAGCLGIFKYKEGGANAFGDPYPSGHGYHPMTVSDMVADPATPEGKCFFAFCLTGAICILISGYPWKLRNVYVGDDHQIGCTGCPFGLTMLNLRQFLPPVGMLLVCCITVTRGQRTISESIAASVHTMGAVMMIGGYIFFECHSLWVLRNVTTASGKPHIKPTEKKIRIFLMVICAITALGFQVCGVVGSKVQARCAASGACDCVEPKEGLGTVFNPKWYTTCTDIYKIPTKEDLEEAENESRYGRLAALADAWEFKRSVIYNTAGGWFLTLKMVNFWCEVVAGLSMLASHGVIYYNCEERKLDLEERLPPLRSHMVKGGYVEEFERDDSYRQIS